MPLPAKPSRRGFIVPQWKKTFGPRPGVAAPLGREAPHAPSTGGDAPPRGPEQPTHRPGAPQPRKER